MRGGEVVSAALSVADVLERAANLIEPEGAWTQGEYARNAYGSGFIHNRRYPHGPPVCFCLNGAINFVAGNRVTQDYTPAQRIVESMFDDGATGTWNDAPERTQAEVVAKLREAAALARTETVK